jgi:hypothetical protein
MRATGWKGGVYGVRVGKANASRFFPKMATCVEVEIDGHPHSFTLSETFWTTCPEIRGAPIGRWLRAQGLAPWQSGRPPRVNLLPLGGNKFRLQL